MSPTPGSSASSAASGTRRPAARTGTCPPFGPHPTEVTVGRSCKLNVFACSTGPDHPNRWSIQ
ncbi:hypothetical protein CP969_00230 [Streptomyces viridosporus T7A]|uniref:Uncharacterized protein n=1 Tax=Streptomyces viridosporus T7A TaxID=665577 RepID=A0ABX6A6R0_STRVD|nr:hypothetical protein CP969_00230 [Streptomyces viridosporus T7A]